MGPPAKRDESLRVCGSIPLSSAKTYYKGNIMKEELIESIGKMVATGNRLELPTEQISNYPAVKKALLAAGGKYKRSGFDFQESAQTIKDRLCGGEVIDDIKKYQYYPTPKVLAEQLVSMSEIEPHHMVLEPSAGQGAIVDVIPECAMLMLVELMPQNAIVLRRKYYPPKVVVVEQDFLTVDVETGFDRIVANPPFTKNQDIDHVMHMYDLLKPGGRIVSVMSSSWTFGIQKKQVAFRDFLHSIGAAYHVVGSGTFKESGTNVNSMVVEINKPF